MVNSIASQANYRTKVVQYFHNMVFMFGKYLGKTICILYGFSELPGFVVFGDAERTGIENVGSHSQFLRCFPCDSDLISGHHFDFNTHLLGRCDGFSGFIPRWIEEWQYPEELPLTLRVSSGHTK